MSKFVADKLLGLTSRVGLLQKSPSLNPGNKSLPPTLPPTHNDALVQYLSLQGTAMAVPFQPAARHGTPWGLLLLQLP